MTQPRRPLSLKSMQSDALPADELEALRAAGWRRTDRTFSIRIADLRLTEAERRVLIGIGQRLWGGVMIGMRKAK